MAQSELHTKKCMTHILRDREVVREVMVKRQGQALKGKGLFCCSVGTASAESRKKKDLQGLDAHRSNCHWL